MTPEFAFYVKAVLLGVATAASAVLWDRWYIKRLIRKEFVRQLWLEQRRREVNGE